MQKKCFCCTALFVRPYFISKPCYIYCQILFCSSHPQSRYGTQVNSGHQSHKRHGHNTGQTPIGSGCCSVIRFSYCELLTAKRWPPHTHPPNPSILAACCHRSNLNTLRPPFEREFHFIHPKEHHKNIAGCRKPTEKKKRGNSRNNNNHMFHLPRFRYNYQSTAQAPSSFFCSYLEKPGNESESQGTHARGECKEVML